MLPRDRSSLRVALAALVLLAPAAPLLDAPGASATPQVGYKVIEVWMVGQHVGIYEKPDQWDCDASPITQIALSAEVHCTPPSHFLCAGLDLTVEVRGKPGTRVDGYVLCGPLPGDGAGLPCRASLEGPLTTGASCSASMETDVTNVHHVTCGTQERPVTMLPFRLTVTCGIHAEPWPPR